MSTAQYQRSSSSQRHHQTHEPKPQHIQYLETLLQQQGVEYYEKNVTAQLVEFMGHHTAGVINEATQNRIYREQGKHVTSSTGQEPQHVISTPINSADIKLAMKFKDIKNSHISSHTIQQYAEVKNKKSLHDLVLGPFSNLEQKAIDEISDPIERRSKLSSTILQKQQKMINFDWNSLPKMGMTFFRLDQPNFQVQSEEINNQISDKLRNTYKLPIKDLNTKFLAQKQAEADNQSQINKKSNLGRRDRVDNDQIMDKGSQKVQRIEFDDNIQLQILENTKREIDQEERRQNQMEDQIDWKGGKTAQPLDQSIGMMSTANANLGGSLMRPQKEDDIDFDDMDDEQPQKQATAQAQPMVIEKMMPLATKVQQQSSLARNDESSEDEDNLFDN